MAESLDAERVSSYVILCITLALVGGLLIDQAHLHSQGLEYGISIAGVILIMYGIGATIYLLMKSKNSHE